MRRLGAAAVLLACVVVLPGQATAVDPPPDVTISDPAPVGEGGTATFTITRSGDVTEATTVTATTADGTAQAPGDYTGNPGATVTIPIDATSATFDVVTNQDGLDENDETFAVNLSAPTNGNITDAQGIGTIQDDDTLPTVSIAGATSTVTEGGQATFNVTLSASYPETVTVNWSTQNGSAASGSDYTTNGGPVTFNAGETGPKQVSVNTTNDTIDEDSETFIVNLTAPNNATIGTGQATGTIDDNDDPPSVTIGDVAVTEGDSGTLSANFPVALSGPSGKTITVGFATAAGTAGAGDFESATGTLTILAGATTGTISVAVKGDTLSEPQEQFFVNIFGPTNATLGADTQGRATITDDDVPPVINSIDDPIVAEGNADVTVNFLVTLSAASSVAVTVRYSTADGTAKAGDDYVSVQNATLTIPANTTSAAIPITVKGDLLAEAEEFFFVNLFGPTTNATLGSNTQGKATITDADPVPVPTVAPASVTEGNAGAGTTNLVFQVTLPGPRPQMTFNYRTVAGSATSSDFTEVGGAPLVFPAGPSATTLPVTIRVNGDTLDENNESFTLELLSPTSGAVVASAPGTIVNDDNNSKLSISDTTADEPSAGAVTMKFTVTLAPASGRAVSVNWATAGGTATAGVDYTAGSGGLSFAPGETSKEIVVSVTGDELNEENETVLVNITGAGAGVVDGQGQGTIIDKNAPPSLAISDTVTRENGSGAEFTVTLAGTTLRSVTVRFSTSDGSAKAGSDYVARVGTLTFAPGEKTKAIAVTVVDDTAAESAEDFSVGLGDPVNGTITKSRGMASIEASDQVPTKPRAPTAPNVKPVAKTTTLLPRMLLGPRTVTIAAAGVARMLVTCNKASPIACSGSVALETVVKPKLQLGKKSFSVKKGKKVYVPIKLSARSLERLLLKGTLKAKAIVMVKTGTKTLRVVPGVITLKLKPGTKFKAPPTKVIVDSP